MRRKERRKDRKRKGKGGMLRAFPLSIKTSRLHHQRAYTERGREKGGKRWSCAQRRCQGCGSTRTPLPRCGVGFSGTCQQDKEREGWREGEREGERRRTDTKQGPREDERAAQRTTRTRWARCVTSGVSSEVSISVCSRTRSLWSAAIDGLGPGEERAEVAASAGRRQRDRSIC